MTGSASVGSAGWTRTSGADPAGSEVTGSDGVVCAQTALALPHSAMKEIRRGDFIACNIRPWWRLPRSEGGWKREKYRVIQRNTASSPIALSLAKAGTQCGLRREMIR